MNSVIGLKSPGWDLNKSKYPDIDDLPLMATIGPVLVILALYLVFVLKVGPSFMRKREAYKLTHVMLAYNVVQVLISVYLVARFLSNLLDMGLVPRVCYMDHDVWRSKILFGTYLYLSAKLTELLDTVFFVLRKKENQISFLHLYHHSVMVIATWAMLKYWPSHTLAFIGFFNSLVHVFMYTYYALAALGPNVAKYLTWKKYMTKFQLIQFVSIIIQYLATLRVSECPPSKGVAIFVSCNTAFFLLLFLNFYRQSYVTRNSKKLITGSDTQKGIISHEHVKNIVYSSKSNDAFKTKSVMYDTDLSEITENNKKLSNATDISNFIQEISTERKYSLKND